MQQVSIIGPRQAKLIDVPDPQPKDNWVVVKILTAPMCTEFKAFVDGRAGSAFGHEAAGEVVAVAQPCRVKIGDRVAVMPTSPCGACPLCLAGNYIHCRQQVDVAAFTGSTTGRATMAQYLVKPDWLLVPIPDKVSIDHGSMACCGLGATFGALDHMDVGAYDTLMVTGLGPVGLGAVLHGAYRGANVIGVESNPWRARRALELGAKTVINPTDEDALAQILDLTAGVGVDKSVDCSGVPAAHRLCIDATKRRGIVSFVGESQAETPLNISQDMLRKGLTLYGSWHYNLALGPKIMQLIADLGPKLDHFISHRYPMTRVQEAWETQSSGQCAKILLRPWAEES
jgi:L-iditol 2-dehydrogenase